MLRDRKGAYASLTQGRPGRLLEVDPVVEAPPLFCACRGGVVPGWIYMEDWG